MNSHEKNYFWKYGIGGFLAMLVLIGADQWTKHLAELHLKGQAPIPLIDGVLELYYLENRGAAFGILQNRQWIFLLICAAVLLAAAYLFVKMPKTPRMLPLFFVLLLAVSGGVGNAIDRLTNGYVIDFIYVSLIDFPVFNVADCYVVLCAAAALFLVLFYYKDEDFDFLSRRKG